MTTELTARLADYAHLARDLGVDAVALAPGPNFDVYDTVLRANRKDTRSPARASRRTRSTTR